MPQVWDMIREYVGGKDNLELLTGDAATDRANRVFERFLLREDHVRRSLAPPCRNWRCCRDARVESLHAMVAASPGPMLLIVPATTPPLVLGPPTEVLDLVETIDPDELVLTGDGERFVIHVRGGWIHAAGRLPCDRSQRRNALLAALVATSVLVISVAANQGVMHAGYTSFFSQRPVLMAVGYLLAAGAGFALTVRMLEHTRRGVVGDRLRLAAGIVVTVASTSAVPCLLAAP